MKLKLLVPVSIKVMVTLNMTGLILTAQWLTFTTPRRVWFTPDIPSFYKMNSPALLEKNFKARQMDCFGWPCNPKFTGLDLPSKNGSRHGPHAHGSYWLNTVDGRRCLLAFPDVGGHDGRYDDPVSGSVDSHLRSYS